MKLFNAIIYNSLEVETVYIQSLSEKTNLKFDSPNFNIFGSSEYEKIDILLKQLNFVSLKKLFKINNM